MRSQKALLNFISSLMLMLINVAIGLITPRLYIEAYGSEINGLISSVTQFITYLAIVEAGVGAASIAALYSPISLGDKNNINNILSATRTFYKRSGYLYLILVLILALFYPVIIKGEISATISFLMVLTLGVSGMFELLVIGKYQVMLTADQKSYIVNFIKIVGLLLNFLCCIVMIKSGFQVLTVQIACTLVYVSRMFILIVYVKKRYSFICFDATPNFKAINNRWDAFIHQIAGLAVFSTPIIIVTIFCGLKEVSVFSIYSMVITGVIMLVSAFSNGLMAGFGEIMARKERVTLLRTFHDFEVMYYMVMTWAFVCTSLLLLPFVKVYTTNIHDIDYVRSSVAILFIIVGISNCIRIPPMTLVQAAGHYTQTKNRAILEALINLTVSLILVRYWGIEGVLIGSICSYAYRTIDFIVYTSRHILIRPIRVTIYKLVRSLVLATVAVVPFYTFIHIQIDTFPEWIRWAFIVSCWTLIVMILGNSIVDINTMKSIVSRLKRLKPNLKKHNKIEEFN